MAQDLNTLAIVGRVTRDAELSYLNSGTAKATFAIAVNRSVKKGDQWTDEVSYFDLTLWGKQAENLTKYLTKGTQVGITGSLQQRRWEKDGQKQSKVEIHVENIQLIGGQRQGHQEPAYTGSPAQNGGVSQGGFEDDIPF